jgi:hypothetical protein
MSGSIAPVSAAPMASASTSSTTSSSSATSISSSTSPNCPPHGHHGCCGPKPHHGLTKEGVAFLALLALAGKKNKDKEMSLMEKLALLAIAFGPKEHHCAAMNNFNSSMSAATNTDMVMNSGISAVSYTAEGTMNASVPTGAVYSASV